MVKERLTLTLERYHRFFVDPYGTRLTTVHLNNIIYMHGFARLPGKKSQIMDHMAGQVDLQPPRRSTLHSSAALAPPSAARRPRPTSTPSAGRSAPSAASPPSPPSLTRRTRWSPCPRPPTTCSRWRCACAARAPRGRAPPPTSALPLPRPTRPR